jgi:regulator of RNase E activity RraA
VVIAAGDLIVADRDGVVVVPQAKIGVVAERVDVATANEQALRERIIAAGRAVRSSGSER